MLTAVLTFATISQAMQFYNYLIGIQKDYPDRILEVEVNFDSVEVLFTATREIVETVVSRSEAAHQA